MRRNDPFVATTRSTTCTKAKKLVLTLARACRCMADRRLTNTFCMACQDMCYRDHCADAGQSEAENITSIVQHSNFYRTAFDVARTCFGPLKSAMLTFS
jgi:hypothetical protein